MGRRISVLIAVPAFTAAIAACTGASSTTTVLGRIADARTGAALTGVSVIAGRLSATSTKNGGFELKDVPKKATVTIQFPNYRSLNRRATSRFERVRLARLSR